MKKTAIYISSHESIREIDPTQWDLFASSPFVSHTFLRILEEAKCVGGDTGWIPVYLLATNEEKKIKELGVSTKVFLGEDITEAHVSQMFEFYRSTVNKFHRGRQYLNETFFQHVREKIPESLHLVFAEQENEVFAGAFNLIDDERLYGRYWGCNKEVPYAHFEVCMYTPIEWCIENNIKVFEPGAGGEHKFERGFTPTKTHSAHYLRNARLRRAVSESLDHERLTLEKQFNYFRTQSPFKEPGF